MKPIIKQDPEKPLEILAEDIKSMAELGRIFKTSRLKEKTVLVLVSHMTGMAQRDVKTVLEALPLLEKEYLKP